MMKFHCAPAITFTFLLQESDLVKLAGIEEKYNGNIKSLESAIAVNQGLKLSDDSIAKGKISNKIINFSQITDSAAKDADKFINEGFNSAGNIIETARKTVEAAINVKNEMLDGSKVLAESTNSFLTGNIGGRKPTSFDQVTDGITGFGNYNFTIGLQGNSRPNEDQSRLILGTAWSNMEKLEDQFPGLGFSGNWTSFNELATFSGLSSSGMGIAAIPPLRPPHIFQNFRNSRETGGSTIGASTVQTFNSGKSIGEGEVNGYGFPKNGSERRMTGGNRNSTGIQNVGGSEGRGRQAVNVNSTPIQLSLPFSLPAMNSNSRKALRPQYSRRQYQDLSSGRGLRRSGSIPRA